VLPLDFAAGLVLGCLLGVVATLGILLLIAATANEQGRKTKRLSPWGLAIAASAILVVTVAARLVSLRDGGLALLLLLIILTVSRWRGLYTGLAASVFASLVLSVVFAPSWSLKVTRPGDQLLLALFILGGTLGSHMASRAEAPAGNTAGVAGDPESKLGPQLVVSETCSDEQAS
jgi:K+-sensing histidine kinase KdpD